MENRSLALRYLSDALNMDSIGNYQAAFAKYLQSLHVLTSYLNEMFTTSGFQKMLEKNKEIKQVLCMIHECSDRITIIVNGGKNNSTTAVGNEEDTSTINTDSDSINSRTVSNRLHTDGDVINSYSKKFPAVEKLHNDNMVLLKRYKWRFERAKDKNAKANLKLELERQLIENDMIAKKKFDVAVKQLQKERVQLMEKEMKKLLDTRQNLNEQQKEKQELYLSVLHYTKTETWPCTWTLSPLEMTDTEAAQKIFQKTVRCSGHPLSQWLLVMQTNIKREIDAKMKHCSNYKPFLPEPSAVESMEEYLLSFTENSDEFIINSSKAGSISIPNKFRLSLQKFLENISFEITNMIENVLEIFYLSYKSLLPVDSEEICHRLIETYILAPIWSNLIILFRISNLSSEYKILETMISHKNSDPAKFGFTSKEHIDSEVFSECISLLQKLTRCNSLSEKLRSLVDVTKTICGDFPQHLVTSNRRRLGADDLMPLLCYVIAKSGLPQLSSECFAIEQLFDMKYMFGEEGYALSSFLTALKYIEIRKVIDEEHVEQDKD